MTDFTRLTAAERLRAQGAMNALDVAGVRIKELEREAERLRGQIKHITNVAATALEENVILRSPITEAEIDRLNPGLLEVDFANEVIALRAAPTPVVQDVTK